MVVTASQDPINVPFWEPHGLPPAAVNYDAIPSVEG